MAEATENNPTADNPPIDQLKLAAANAAVAQLESGMIVGLGSGSTATLAIGAMGKRVAEEGLRIIGIPTSEKSAALARRVDIPLTTLGEHPRIDVTIDGADEVEVGALNLIKGGGGDLLREKIVASASARLVIIVDETKLVDRLGRRFAVPVEVEPFGWQSTAIHLKRLRADPTLRLAPDGRTFVTDGGHYILDMAFGPIESPATLDESLNNIVGVMEHGLFIGLASQVIVGSSKGVRMLFRSGAK
ncbi:MAG: ribose-5-phosphate isomerase RpiA [Candidatus Acidiferrales bacterium]